MVMVVARLLWSEKVTFLERSSCILIYVLDRVLKV